MSLQSIAHKCHQYPTHTHTHNLDSLFVGSFVEMFLFFVATNWTVWVGTMWIPILEMLCNWLETFRNRDPTFPKTCTQINDEFLLDMSLVQTFRPVQCAFHIQNMFLQTLLVFGISFALAEDVSLESAKQGLTSDDECFEGEEQCALNALQLRQTELDDPWMCSNDFVSFPKWIQRDWLFAPSFLYFKTT